MESNQTHKDFVEAMLKLRRDITKLNNLGGLIPSISLRINNETIIGFSAKNKSWTIQSNYFNNENWNPKISEIIQFLNNYEDYDLLIAVQNMNEQFNNYFKSIDGTLLLPEIKNIFNLLSFEENSNINIEIETNSNTLLIINFDGISFNASLDSKKVKLLIDADIISILKNINYFNTSKALNECYDRLNRKR